MKARKGRDTLTKIKIKGFPTEIIVDCTKGIHWLDPYRREFKSYQNKIYHAAIAAAKKPNDEHQKDYIPVITPLEDTGITHPQIQVDDIHRCADLATEAADGWDIFDIWTSCEELCEPDNMIFEQDSFDR
jgi:hypothetical protein